MKRNSETFRVAFLSDDHSGHCLSYCDYIFGTAGRAGGADSTSRLIETGLIPDLSLVWSGESATLNDQIFQETVIDPWRERLSPDARRLLEGLSQSQKNLLLRSKIRQESLIEIVNIPGMTTELLNRLLVATESSAAIRKELTGILDQEGPKRDPSLRRLHLAGISVTDGVYEQAILEKVRPESRERTTDLLVRLNKTAAGMILAGIKSGEIDSKCLDSLYPALGVLNNISGEQTKEAIRLTERVGGDSKTLESIGRGLQYGYLQLSDLSNKSPAYLSVLARLLNEDLSKDHKKRLGPQGFQLVLSEERGVMNALELVNVAELHALLSGTTPADLILYGIASNKHANIAPLRKETFEALCVSSRNGRFTLEQVQTIARSIANGRITDSDLSRLLEEPATLTKADSERIFILLEVGREEDIKKVVDLLERGDMKQVKSQTEVLVTDELAEKHKRRLTGFLERFDPEKRIPLGHVPPYRIHKKTLEWLKAFCERDYDRALRIAKSDSPLYKIELKDFTIDLSDLNNERRLKECVDAILKHGSADLKGGERVATLTRLLLRLPNGALIDISAPEIDSINGVATGATRALMDSLKSHQVIRKLRGLLAHQAWEECLVHMEQPERGVLSPTCRKFLSLARTNKSHEYFQNLPDPVLKEQKFYEAMREIDAAALLIDAGMSPEHARELLSNNHPVRNSFFSWVDVELELRERFIRSIDELKNRTDIDTSRLPKLEKHLILSSAYRKDKESAPVVSKERPPGKASQTSPLPFEIVDRPANQSAPTKGSNPKRTGIRTQSERLRKARGGGASALVLFGPLIEKWFSQNSEGQ